MTDDQAAVAARIYRTWIERLEEVLTLDRENLPPRTLQLALRLLHDLFGVGLRAGAVDCVVTHSSGPVGFAHLTYRYPLREDFDWDGEIRLGPLAFQPEDIDAQIAEIERAAITPDDE